jgi:hypothetical protein
MTTRAAYSAAMQTLHVVAPAYLELAHRIAWATVATVDSLNRPRSRILHPLWEWDGSTLVGWACTLPTALKRRHLAHSEYVSCSYWNDAHDSAIAECRAELYFDDVTCTRVYEKFKTAAPPVGFDPALVEGWESPSSEKFAVMRFEPWRLRVVSPSYSLSAGDEGEVLRWVRDG